MNSIISRAEPVLSGGGTAAVNFTGYSSEADLLSAIEQCRSTNDIHGNLTFAGNYKYVCSFPACMYICTDMFCAVQTI